MANAAYEGLGILYGAPDFMSIVNIGERCGLPGCCVFAGHDTLRVHTRLK